MRAISEAIISGVATAIAVSIASVILIGDAVSIASRQPYIYQTKITDVFRGGRDCAWNMEFVEENVNRTVIQCADSHASKPQIGDTIKVNTLIGTLGTRIVSTARITQ